jgi:hypothetical protein
VDTFKRGDIVRATRGSGTLYVIVEVPAKYQAGDYPTKIKARGIEGEQCGKLINSLNAESVDFVCHAEGADDAV